MDGTLVAAALCSAALHAAWNAAVKAHARPPLAMTAQMLASAALALPVLGWTGLPASAAWPWMAASTHLLILWVWTHAPIAPASALRDTSAVFATLIAIFVLKEPVDRRALWAVALACAGTVFIRLG